MLFRGARNDAAQLIEILETYDETMQKHVMDGGGYNMGGQRESGESPITKTTR